QLSCRSWSRLQPSLSLVLCGAFVLHGQDPGDLALRQLEAGTVLERPRHGLEAQVEQLLPALRQPVVELVVGQVAEFARPSQRAQPLSSPLCSSPTASVRPAAALPSRAARARRRARTSRARA